MNSDRIVIVIEDGVIRNVYSRDKREVTIIDWDTDGADEEDIKEVLGSEAYIYGGITSTTVDTQLIQAVEKDLDINPKERAENGES